MGTKVRESLEVSPQVLDQLNREPLKEALVLSCIISILFFLSFSSFLSLSPIVPSSLPYVFLHKVVSWIYIFITYQKKKKKNGYKSNGISEEDKRRK